MTGISTCSNETENGLPCPVADFPEQDAEFGSNGFDFTKLDAAGNELLAFLSSDDFSVAFL
ncbi:hypothetical protein CKO12_06305 [Chromatium okenii]|uniref:hypothetical protein n=1 Tax=Chromatium okenii TaxID=61644 RepID=UPI0019032EC8|nr:hypothetical protein [Chromatium okenii]MBK1641493.1 hypothetical protein [Chromatium okenii]